MNLSLMRLHFESDHHVYLIQLESDEVSEKLRLFTRCCLVGLRPQCLETATFVSLQEGTFFHETVQLIDWVDGYFDMDSCGRCFNLSCFSESIPQSPSDRFDQL